MAKGKTATVFFCQNCGYESTKWLGQCPGCREWNTFVEETIDKTELKNTGNGAKRDRREASEPCVLSEIAIREENKTLTGIKELDRVLGGGIVQGSLTLVGGDPGIGKSTLLLQVCHNLSTAGHKVLYISGEESKVQIKMRADQILRVPPDHRRLQEPVGCEGHYSGVLRLCYRYWGGDCAGCGERGDLRNKKVRGIDFSIPLGV